MRVIGQRCGAAALAGAVLVATAAAEWTLDVSCPSQRSVTLTITGLTASYECADRTEAVQMGSGYFMVDVNVEALELELKGSSVDILYVPLCLPRSRSLLLCLCSTVNAQVKTSV